MAKEEKDQIQYYLDKMTVDVDDLIDEADKEQDDFDHRPGYDSDKGIPDYCGSLLDELDQIENELENLDMIIPDKKKVKAPVNPSPDDLLNKQPKKTEKTDQPTKENTEQAVVETTEQDLASEESVEENQEVAEENVVETDEITEPQLGDEVDQEPIPETDEEDITEEATEEAS